MISPRGEMPFFTENYEGFDVNSGYDWSLAEELVRRDEAKLPGITQMPLGSI